MAHTHEHAGPSRSSWAAHARRQLAGAGHRAGGARDEVISLIGSQSCCLSAQEIHLRLRAGERSVGLASVYRALDALAGLGLVHRVDVDGTACFEPADPSGDHHHHAVCTVCGRLAPFADAELERRLDELAERVGFTIDGHDVVLRGRCPQCTAAA